MDRDALLAWLAVIDEVSYYELLGVDPAAGQDEVRRAFHGFAATFHPDAHGVRAETERSAIRRIFTRGTEAYRVLSDVNLRARYDLQRAGPSRAARIRGPLSRGTTMRAPALPPPVLGALSAPPGATASTAGRLEDHVRPTRARPFAREAEALAKKCEYAKAKLQLKLAMGMDPENPALESYLRDLEARIAEVKRRPGGR
jgi:curved DNA-binding protein CbpA